MAQLTKEQQAMVLDYYNLGKRVELHPAMAGDRYGTIVKVNKFNVSIKMDSGRILEATENDYRVGIMALDGERYTY